MIYRGNVRSLWMGCAWALTSGSGVAIALLLGAAGPLIGVAISASLLPPVVNCVSFSVSIFIIFLRQLFNFFFCSKTKQCRHIFNFMLVL